MDKIGAIKAVARNLQDLVIDASPASLTGSSLMFDELIHPNSGQLRGNWAYIYDGAGAGQERVTGSFNPTKNELVFAQVFASTPSLNSSVIVTKTWSKSDYENSVDRAFGIAKQSFLEEMVGTAQIVATQYEYAVPSGIEWISTIRIVPTQATDYSADDEVDRIFEFPPRFWRIEKLTTGSYVISFDPR
jgi:hypothetical protein